MVNLYSGHMDPDDWQQPQQFRPERFLDESGNVINRDRVIAFSLGMDVRSTDCVLQFRMCIHIYPCSRASSRRGLYLALTFNFKGVRSKHTLLIFVLLYSSYVSLRDVMPLMHLRHVPPSSPDIATRPVEKGEFSRVYQMASF